MIGWLPHSANPVYAGSRIRCLTPMRILRSRGVPIELFNASRWNEYDLVIVQGLCFRPPDDQLEKTDALLQLIFKLHEKGCRIILEDCDNHFYNPYMSPEIAKMADGILQTISIASYLVASTQGVADIFKSVAERCPPIEIVGDAVEQWSDLNFESRWRRHLSWRRKADWWRLKRLHLQIRLERSRGVQQLVWFGANGSSNTDGGMRDILRIREILKDLHSEYPFSLSIISNSSSRYDEIFAGFPVPTRYFEWSRTTFLHAMKLHDIAVIPVTRTEFTTCKSNNRLLLAMSCGLAVCADGIPAYQPFSHFCSLNDWATGLRSYLKSKTLREAHCSAARSEISANWNAECIANQWGRIISRALERAP